MPDCAIYRPKALSKSLHQTLDRDLAYEDFVRLDPEVDVVGLRGLPRADLFGYVASILRHKQVRSLLVIPSEPEDLLLAQAVSSIAGAPLGLWLLQDWNFTATPHFAETFSIATAVFASSSEMRTLLQHQMQRLVYVMPTQLTPELPPINIFGVLFDTVRNHGRLSDGRMERALIARDGPPSFYFDQAPPRGIHKIYQPAFQLCERLREAGWYPDFALDIGASNGIWSSTMSQAFPNTKFVLCDPIMSRYPQCHDSPQMLKLNVAVGNEPGKAFLKVSSDLFGSSFIAAPDKIDLVEVEVVTIDQVVSEQSLSGRGLVKVDVQFTEHLVIEGGLRALAESIDLIILELSLTRVTPEHLNLLEVTKRLDKLGFRIFDIVGEWRDTRTGEAVQFDVAFARHDLPNISH